MSWSASLSGHIDGEDAAEKEAEVKKLVGEFLSSGKLHGLTSGSWYGQFTEPESYPKPTTE